MTGIALLFDDHAAGHWRDGEPPRTAFSHDQNLFQMAHEALRLGMAVHVSTIGAYLHGGPAMPVRAIYPALRMDASGPALQALDPDILACVHPQVFAGGQLPRAKKLGVHPALYFIEMPHTYGDAQTLLLLQAVRFHIDHLVVQNERMRELTCALYEWLCGWRARERVHVAPLGIVPEQPLDRRDRVALRRAYGLGEGDVAILNGGGIWRWTAFNEFLRGFCQAVREGAGNLHLLLAGFRQHENTDHADYIAETLAILREHADLVGPPAARAFLGLSPARARSSQAKARIHVEPDWAEASRRLPELLSLADLGLSVSGDTLENWQSHRVRCLDYVRYGLPIIATPGDLFSERTAREITMLAPGRDPGAFAALLHRIARGEFAHLRHGGGLHAGMEAVRDRLDSRSGFGRLLLQVEAMPRRTVGAGDESLLEYAWRRRRAERAGQVLDNLAEAAFRLGR